MTSAGRDLYSEHQRRIFLALHDLVQTLADRRDTSAQRLPTEPKAGRYLCCPRSDLNQHFLSFVVLARVREDGCASAPWRTREEARPLPNQACRVPLNILRRERTYSIPLSSGSSPVTVRGQILSLLLLRVSRSSGPTCGQAQSAVDGPTSGMIRVRGDKTSLYTLLTAHADERCSVMSEEAYA